MKATKKQPYKKLEIWEKVPQTITDISKIS